MPAVLIICTALGFGIARWQQPGDDIPSSTIATMTASLGGHASDMPMAKVAMDAGDATPRAAPSLSTLLPGLEAKVAANPGDFSLRFLLAQTYVELEQYTKAIPLLDALRHEAPKHPEIALLSIKAHLPSANVASLRADLDTLKSLNQGDVDAVDLWMVRGKVLTRLDERGPARDAWLKAQSLLAPGDARATDIEMELAHLANGVKIAQ